MDFIHRLIHRFAPVRILHLWWWVAGYSVCYATNNDGAYCKRRPYHLGTHRTGSGFRFHA